MAERTDFEVNFELAPRLVDITSLSEELSVQDSHDTLTVIQDTVEGGQYEFLVSTTGGEGLGGGTTVGLTTVLNNMQYAFGATSPRSTGALTAADVLGVTLEDSGATFISDGVARGDWVINFSDESITEILEVISETQVYTRGLRNGTANTFTISDSYKIWEVAEAELSGGNFTAIDGNAVDINPLFPVFGRFITKTAASSATATSQEALESGLFGGAVCIDPNFGYPGTGSINNVPIGTRQAPSNNIADTKQICIERGFKLINLMASYEILSEDLSVGYSFTGDSPFFVLTLNPAANVANCAMQLLTVQGEADGLNLVRDCRLLDIDNISGLLHEVDISGDITLSGPTTMSSCHSGFAGDTQSTAIVGANILQVRGFNGSLFADGITAGTHSIGISEGRLVIGGTGGRVNVRGTPYDVVDLSGGLVNIVDQTMSKDIQITRKLLTNKVSVETDNSGTTIYDDDGVTVLHEFTHSDTRNRTPV